MIAFRNIYPPGVMVWVFQDISIFLYARSQLTSKIASKKKTRVVVNLPLARPIRTAILPWKECPLRNRPYLGTNPSKLEHVWNKLGIVISCGRVLFFLTKVWDKKFVFFKDRLDCPPASNVETAGPELSLVAVHWEGWQPALISNLVSPNLFWFFLDQ